MNQQVGCSRNAPLKKGILLIGVVAVVIFVTVVVLVPSLGKAGPTSRECSSVIAYLNKSGWNPDYSLGVYSNGKSGDMLSLKETDVVLLDYSYDRKQWVLFDKYAKELNHEDVIILLDGNRTQRIQVRLPKDAFLQCAKVYDDLLYIPSVDNGVFVQLCYNLDGKLISTRRFPTPGFHVGNRYEVAMDVAPNGYVSAQLTTNDEPVSSEPQYTYIFNDQNKVLKKIESSWCQFSADGKSVAYSGRGNGITILDLVTGGERVVDVWPPKNMPAAERMIVKSTGGYRWDSKNQWLFVKYIGDDDGYRPVYAFDLKQAQPGVQRLPFEVYENWCILDKDPK